MEFGVNIFTRGIGATPDGITAVAEAAERLGFGLVAVNDHIVVPGDIHSRYPYSASGEWPGRAVGECLDQISALAFLAARTSKVRLLTSVMVLPHRSPVLAAKMLATLDVLSNGRLTLGCGVGWLEEELTAIGAPPFAERGRVSDEYLTVFKDLWTSEAPAYQGDYVQYADISFLPKPVQKPHPPIWIGGESGRALRRVVEFGDGWYPAGNNPRHPLTSAARYGDGVAALREKAEAAGRDPASLDLGYMTPWVSDPEPQPDENGERRIFTGPSQAVIDDLGQFGDLGLRHLILSFQGESVRQSADRMDWFSREVMPAMTGGA